MFINILVPFILIFISFGLAQIFFSKNELSTAPITIQIISGYILISVLVFILNIFLKINLLLSYYIVSALALFGFSKFYSIHFHKIKITRDQFYNYISTKEFFNIFLINMLVFILFFYSWGSNYKPKHWDEFTHWMLMPKQIFMFKSLADPHFPIKDFLHYPPGLSIIGNYFQILFLNGFSESIYIISYFTHFILLNFLLFQLGFKKIFNLTLSLSLAYFLLILFFEILFKDIFPTSVLCETQQILCLFSIIIILYYFIENKINNFNFIMKIEFLFISFSYLIKPSSLSYITLFLVYNWFYSSFTKKQKILSLFLNLVNVIFLIYLWKNHIKDIQLVTKTAVITSISSFEKIILFLSTFTITFKQILVSLFSLKGIFIFIPLSLLFKKHIPRSLFNIVYIFCVFYIIGLTITYGTSFNAYESNKLASFDRYMSLPMSSIKLILVLAFYNYLRNFNSNTEFYIRLLERIKTHSRSLSIFTILTFASYTSFKIYNLYLKKDENYSELLNTVTKMNSQILSSQQFKTITIPASLQILDQGGHGSIYHIARYSSLYENLILYIVLPNFSFSKTQDNPWTTVTDEIQFQNTFKSSQYYLILNLDSWSKMIIDNLYPNCKNLKTPYSIINTDISSPICKEL